MMGFATAQAIPRGYVATEYTVQFTDQVVGQSCGARFVLLHRAAYCFRISHLELGRLDDTSEPITSGCTIEFECPTQCPSNRDSFLRSQGGQELASRKFGHDANANTQSITMFTNGTNRRMHHHPLYPAFCRILIAGNRYTNKTTTTTIQCQSDIPPIVPPYLSSIERFPVDSTRHSPIHCRHRRLDPRAHPLRVNFAKVMDMQVEPAHDDQWVKSAGSRPL